MATGKIIVSVVDVGQGQCTFVEIYNTSNTLIHTLLFDCGSDKQSAETQDNLQYIADKVSGMGTPAFDCIFFSHSDKDHISLTKDLLDKFSSSKKPKVKEVWYGGDRTKYTKYKFNILDYLEAQGYCDTADLKAAPSNYTGYDPDKKKYAYHFWASSDSSVHVYAIAANALSDDPDWDDNDLDVTGKTAEALNRVSMVCGLYYAGASYVICGDATNKTMAAIGGLFSAGTTVFDQNVMTTLPHHGSRATGFAVKSSETASFTAKQVVITFSDLMKSHTLTASAYEKHHHPSLELMSYILPSITSPILRDTRLKQKNAHRLTAYFDRDILKKSGISIIKNFVYSFETTTNTFSTRYYDGFPTFSYDIGAFTKAGLSEGLATKGTVINGFASWGFATSSDGSSLVGGYAKLGAPLFTGPTVTAKTFGALAESTDRTEAVITAQEPAVITKTLTASTSPRVEMVFAARPRGAARTPVKGRRGALSGLQSFD